MKHNNIGWLDDSMTMGGPTEEDTNFIADTGASTAEMAEQVAAYQESMLELKQKVVPIGMETDASFPNRRSFITMKKKTCSCVKTGSLATTNHKETLR